MKFCHSERAVDFALSMVTTGLIVAMVFCVLITAFGIVASVIGFKTIADKALTAVAAQNTAAQQQAYSAPYYQNNPSYQGGYGYQNNAQPYRDGYNNNHYSSQPRRNYQASVQNNTASTGQPANNNSTATTAQNNDWYCVCGNKNTAGQKFCSNCGTANPNISK